MYTDPAKLLSMTGLCFLWPLCCHPPTYYSAPSYTTQAGFIYVSSIIHRLHSQLRRLTRPQRTPRQSELNFNNSIVFIYLCIIIFFFSILSTTSSRVIQQKRTPHPITAPRHQSKFNLMQFH